jgi:hypothetical protein
MLTITPAWYGVVRIGPWFFEVGAVGALPRMFTEGVIPKFPIPEQQVTERTGGYIFHSQYSTSRPQPFFADP